jgi:hypothetical protein
MSARRLPARRKQEWGELGPAMRALPNEGWRRMAYHYATNPGGYGSLTAALRAAGLAARSTKANQGRRAWQIGHDDKFIAAVAEIAKKIIRTGGPEAANALMDMIRDKEHSFHGRAVLALLDRVDPVESRSHHTVDVVHKIDPDQEALEEIRALRQLGTPRPKLLEIYGPNGLDRIEALEAAELRRSDKAKVIDAEYVEVTNG